MMPFLNSNVIGESNKHLIILHGFLGMGDNWKSVGKKISELGVCVHLIDQRNHGKSFWDNKFNYKVLASDLEKYLIKNKIYNPIIIGHSMGGKVAMKYALDGNNKIYKLIIVDISPKKYVFNYEIILKALDSLDFIKIKNRIQVENHLINFIDNYGIVQFLMKNLYWKSPGKLALKLNIEVLKNCRNELISEINSNNIFLNETIFLKGQNSNYIDENDSKRILKLFPNSKIITVPDSGHWLHVDNPDFVINIISDLIL